jgi:predicted extracellular nuclease
MTMHFPSKFLNVRSIDRYHGGPLLPLRIASWNLDNLCESADDEHFRLENAGFSIVHTLGSPHILALQELSGETPTEGKPSSAKHNAQRIIEAIIRAGGPQYCYLEVPSTRYEGGKPSAHIRNGYLYRPDRVTVSREIKGATENGGTNPAHILPDHDAFEESRPPLVAQFIDTATNEAYTLVNLHLCSDGGFSRARKGETPPPADAPWQPNADRLHQRLQQAKIVVDYLAKLGRNSGHHVVLGDFNTGTQVSIAGNPAHQGPTSVLEVFEQAGLIDVAKNYQHLPRSVQHKTPQGVRQMTLDYMFTSPTLASRIHTVQRPQVNHIPAPDEPRESRVSDHNPIIIAVAPMQRAQSWGHSGRG